RLLRDHPDAYVILDSKYARLEIYKSILRYAPERSLRERIFPPGAQRAELSEFRTAYPLQNYMLALYHTQAQNRYDDPIVGDFVNRYRAPAVMMWWGDRDLSISLAAHGRQSPRYRPSFHSPPKGLGAHPPTASAPTARRRRRYRPSFASALKGLGANVYVHSLGDPAVIQRFWDRGIGVYSDSPFPPLGGAPTLGQW